MSDFLNKILKIKSSKSYIDYHKYHQGNIFGITKSSRWELVHSNFIAWSLSSESSHALGFFPLYQFVCAIGVIQNNADNISARKIDTDLLYQFYSNNYIVDATVGREKYANKKHIDILIEITTKDKTLPIIIENKVDSPENGANKDQTEEYFRWAEREYSDRTIYFEPIYIFLYPEYKGTKQKSDKYIRMTYQDLIDFVLDPSLEKCSDIISINNYKQYLQALSFQTDNEKGIYAMGISGEEKKILDEFVAENKALVLEVLKEYDDLSPAVKTAISGTLKKDYTQYKFNGDTKKKGPLVLAVVKQYVADNSSIGFSDLQKAFPDSLQGSKGVVRLETAVTPADKGIGGKRRYFIKASDVITLPATGERVLVSVDWSISSIKNFINHVTTTFGYKIDEV